MGHPLEPLPEEFVRRLRRIVPEGTRETVLASFEAEKPTAFRVNTLNATVGEVADELRREGVSLEPVPWLAEAFTVPPDQRRALTETAAVAEGRVYIQDLSSMAAPSVLAPQPGEAILDLAAAPGGKTLHMAAMMQNQGTLSAVESVRKRFFRLKENLKRHGATMVRTYLADGRSIGRKVPGRFDRVLLDAPCSSEARFDRRHPATWKYWSLKKIRESARKQKGLLRSGLAALKPGGLLLYCTCSFAPEENEAIVDGLLRQCVEAVEVLPIELPLSNLQPGLTGWEDREFHPAVARCIRILSNEELNGLFLCLLRKTDGTEPVPYRARPGILNPEPPGTPNRVGNVAGTAADGGRAEAAPHRPGFARPRGPEINRAGPEDRDARPNARRRGVAQDNPGR